MGFYDNITIAVLGGIIALDKSAFHLFFSEPIIICSVAGAYLGDIESGFMLGMIWQLIWLGEIPIGAAVMSDGSTGALVSLGVYLRFLPDYPQLGNFLFVICLLYGVLGAYWGGNFTGDKRKFHNRYLNYVDKFVREVRPKGVESVFFLGLLEQFLSGAFFTWLLFFIFSIPTRFVIQRMPEYWNGLFIDMKSIAIGIGVAVLVNLFWNRKTVFSLILGISIGIVFIFLL